MIFKSSHLKRFCKECGNITHLGYNPKNSVTSSTYINTIMAGVCIILFLILALATRV